MQSTNSPQLKLPLQNKINMVLQRTCKVVEFVAYPTTLLAMHSYDPESFAETFMTLKCLVAERTFPSFLQTTLGSG